MSRKFNYLSKGINILARGMGVASNRQELLDFAKIKNDQADTLFSLQKTKRRQTVNN